MTHSASIADIRAATDTVFGVLTEFVLRSVDPCTIDRNAGRFLTAAVNITGGWNGIVAVSSTDVFARRTAAAFFMIEPHEVAADEVTDAFGELANMIGGNVNALIPGPSRISLPVVTDGVNYPVTFPGAIEETSGSFVAADEPLIVSVLRRAV